MFPLLSAASVSPCFYTPEYHPVGLSTVWGIHTQHSKQSGKLNLKASLSQAVLQIYFDVTETLVGQDIVCYQN